MNVWPMALGTALRILKATVFASRAQRGPALQRDGLAQPLDPGLTLERAEAAVRDASGFGAALAGSPGFYSNCPWNRRFDL